MGLGSGWNLPPGCHESDIPGNRPRDAAFDHFLESDDCPDSDDDDEVEEAFRKWLKDQEAADADRRLARLEDAADY